MKRAELLRHLREHGCVFIREGGSHSWWGNPVQNRRSSVPRHTEIMATSPARSARTWVSLSQDDGTEPSHAGDAVPMRQTGVQFPQVKRFGLFERHSAALSGIAQEIGRPADQIWPGLGRRQLLAA